MGGWISSSSHARLRLRVSVSVRVGFSVRESWGMRLLVSSVLRLELGIGLRLRLGLERVLSDDPGIEIGLTVV